MGRRVFFDVAAPRLRVRHRRLRHPRRRPGDQARRVREAQDQAAQHRRAPLPDHRPGHLPRHRPARPQAADRRAAAQRRGDRPGRHPQRDLQRQALLVLRRHRPARLRARQLRHVRAPRPTCPRSSTRTGGIDLKYFTGPDGFARPHGPDEGRGRVWLSGLVVLPDESGRERMLAYFSRRRGLGAVARGGLRRLQRREGRSSRSSRMSRSGRPTRPPATPPASEDADGTEYVYFTAPYPALRVKADWKSYLDLASYEGYTCLKPGTRTATRTRPSSIATPTASSSGAGRRTRRPWASRNSRRPDRRRQDETRGVAASASRTPMAASRSCCTTARASGMTTARSTS